MYAFNVQFQETLTFPHISLDAAGFFHVVGGFVCFWYIWIGSVWNINISILSECVVYIFFMFGIDEYNKARTQVAHCLLYVAGGL